MNIDAVKQMLDEVNALLRPTRITVSLEDGKVVFTNGIIKVTETLELFEGAVEFAKLAEIEPPTATYTKGYYEHFLTWPSMAARLPFRSGAAQEILTSQDGALRCTLSRPSLKFTLAVLRQNPTLPLRALMGMRTMNSSSIHRLVEDECLGFSDVFLSGFTIKIFDDAAKKTRADLSSIADATLFNYAYGQSQVLVPARSWEPLSRLLRHRRREAVQFPRRLYNRDLVAYYQLAMSSESALLAYLSLYNVLEYFFSAATEHVLHTKLSDLLVLPDFSHTKAKKLRELAKVVRTHDQKVKEELALRLVIENKFDLSEIGNWLKSYEDAEGIWFTDKKALFGEVVPINLSTDQLAASLSKRIYHLRCLLVHNKEAEGSRYLPFSQDDDHIRRDLPLMVYLAEKLIVATGKDL